VHTLGEPVNDRFGYLYDLERVVGLALYVKSDQAQISNEQIRQALERVVKEEWG